MNFLVFLLLFVSLATAASTLNVTDEDTRIVGGRWASIRNHRHLVQLRYQGFWICGGSLVTTEKVVTASHCVEGSANSPGSFAIKTGSSTKDGVGKIRKVIKIWMHPKYNPRTVDYDIAVLKLIRPVEGKWIKPIPLATKRAKSGQIVNVAGWGLTRDEGGKYPNKLRAVFVPIVGHQRCYRMYRGHITSRMICAGTARGGKDSCSGDSGGPLIRNGKLIGVVSWGYGCADKKYPGVYADVVTLKSFIKSKLKL